MKKLLARTLLTLLSISIVACSERYRDADPGVDGQTAYDQLVSIGESADIEGVNQLDMARLEDLLDKGTLYYAEAPGSLGPVRAVTPINPDYLDPQGRLDSYENIIDIRAYLIIAKNSGNSFDAMLIFDTQFSGNDGQEHTVLTVYNAVSDGKIEEGELQIALADAANNEFVISSQDVSDEDLNEVIKVQMRGISNGDILGQISSMKGFEINL
jgi:hypothetical protein